LNFRLCTINNSAHIHSNVSATRLKAKNSYYAEEWHPTLLWPRSPISATAELLFKILYILRLASIPHRWTDFNDQYVIWRVSAQGRTFWGSRWEWSL